MGLSKQRTEGRKWEVGMRKSEFGSRKCGMGKLEDRGQKTEGRGQKTRLRLTASPRHAEDRIRNSDRRLRKYMI